MDYFTASSPPDSLSSLSRAASLICLFMILDRREVPATPRPRPSRNEEWDSEVMEVSMVNCYCIVNSDRPVHFSEIIRLQIVCTTMNILILIQT